MWSEVVPSAVTSLLLKSSYAPFECWADGLLATSVQKVQSEVVLFTAVFVLLTLLVNAPMLPIVLRMTK